MDGASRRLNVHRLWLLWLGAMAITLVTTQTAQAAQFVVLEADTRLADNVYYLNANIDYQFSDQALEALHSGVPLVVELTIEIERHRLLFWNDTVTKLHQRYRLAYEPLTDRYVVTNLNSGASGYYPTRAMALTALGNINELPILDASLLDRSDHYKARLKTSLDLWALPVPMQVMGYFSSDWRVSSEWYTWPLQ